MELDNLSEVISKLSGEDIEKLQSLADSLMGESSAQGSTLPASSPPPSKIDLEMLMKAKSIMEKMNSTSSKDAQLITALKPYLSEQKQQRADRSLQILRLIEILPYIKELF